MQPGIEAWEPWEPGEFATRMAAAKCPWFVAGGWAVDLFLGTRTRDHEDLEIAVPSSYFETLPPRFPELDFWVPQGEGVLARMTEETLGGDSHQTWAWDRAARAWRFDVFREPHDGDTWICRRDPSIRLPYADVSATTADGVPYLRPEFVLLFKAKHTRDKDRADFEATLPHLSPAQRHWLHDALEKVHPGHDWIAATA